MKTRTGVGSAVASVLLVVAILAAVQAVPRKGVREKARNRDYVELTVKWRKDQIPNSSRVHIEYWTGDHHYFGNSKAAVERFDPRQNVTFVVWQFSPFYRKGQSVKVRAVSTSYPEAFMSCEIRINGRPVGGGPQTSTTGRVTCRTKSGDLAAAALKGAG